MRKIPALLTLLALLPLTGAGELDVASLRALVANARCDEAMTRIEQLSRKERRLPDVRVLEANCLLNEGRSVEEVFLKDRYQRTLLGRGDSGLPAEMTRRFYKTRVTFDEKAREKAIELFRDALRDAPERTDILVGTIAALANADAAPEGAELLAGHKGSLDHSAARDLARVVDDMLRLRNEEGARVIASALVERLGDFPISWLARMRVALVEHDSEVALECAAKLKPLPGGARESLKELAERLLYERRWKELVPLSLELSQREPGALLLFALARDQIAFGSGAGTWKDLDRRLGPSRDPSQPVPVAVAHYTQIHTDGIEPDADLHLAASRFLARRGALESAIAEVDASVRKDATKVEAWIHLATLLRAQFEFDLALDAALEALRHAEGEQASEAAAMAARLHYAQGEDRLALNLLDSHSLDDPLARGMAHLKLGELDAARTWLAKAAAGEGSGASMARAELQALESTPEKP